MRNLLITNSKKARIIDLAFFTLFCYIILLRHFVTPLYMILQRDD